MLENKADTALSIAVMHPHPLVLGALSSLFNSSGNFKVSHLCLNYEQLISAIEISSVHFAIIDIDAQLQKGDTQNLVKTLQCILRKTKIVMYSDQLKGEIIEKLKETGVSGLVSKCDMPQEILKACEQVFLTDKFYISENLQAAENQSMQTKFALSSKELEIIKLVVSGYKLTEIAELKKRSLSTISTHKYNAMRKLGLSSNRELLRFSYENFLL